LCMLSINIGMRAFEIITESEGGIIRRGQEVSQGKTITFAKDNKKINLIGTTVIPEDKLKFETTKELTDAVNATLKANGNTKVQWANNPGVKGGAALITLWADENKQKIAFIKYVNSKKEGNFPITWTNADFGRATGYKQANSAIAQRAQFNLKPNAILPPNTALEVGKLVVSLNLKDKTDLPEDARQQIPVLIQNVIDGVRTPVKGAAKYATTYEVDLGEVAAPIALSTGHFVSGSYKEAEQALLAPLGTNWNNLKRVEFPSGDSQSLYDSYLRINENVVLKISSKDNKGGAAAAVTGLVKDIETSPERFENITRKKQYQEILVIIKIIAAEKAKTGPLVLAEQFRFITETDKNNILNSMGKGMKYDPNASWAKSEGVKAAFKRKGARFKDPAYDMGYHALAGIAELVADHLNKMPGMNEFFKAVLERSTMVQVKTTVSKTGEDAAYTNFQVIYPPVFNGIIKVIAGNNYMATRRPVGKISFKI
jgi:hypothetical protein